MQIVFGALLLVASAALVWIARPAQGLDSAPFLRNWVVGRAYALVALVVPSVGLA